MYRLEWYIRDESGNDYFLSFDDAKTAILDLCSEDDLWNESELDQEWWTKNLAEDNVETLCNLYNRGNDNIFLWRFYVEFKGCNEKINNKINERMIEVAKETYNKLIVLDGNKKEGV